ncbi:hypothetical protein UFOVP679_41 [uncultured Caudovirales phage]|uniref:Uncharacterized protein n=1 Tax=uncultured Caudovirales phage TaxID=2100421 RepID=A0A6J5NDA7_9CAUD|nr:hypothetical protein UFOVP679_41 [uncultured Caudovirales phage]
MTDPTILEQAAAAAREAYGRSCGMAWLSWDKASPEKRAEWLAMTRAVIQTITDHTGSPYTVDELTRILGEA